MSQDNYSTSIAKLYMYGVWSLNVAHTCNVYLPYKAYTIGADMVQCTFFVHGHHISKHFSNDKIKKYFAVTYIAFSWAIYFVSFI